jgi:hypothetical protein
MSNSLKGEVYNWKFDAYIFTSNPTRGMGIKEWNYGKHLKRKLETPPIQLTPIQVLLTPMSKP